MPNLPNKDQRECTKVETKGEKEAKTTVQRHLRIQEQAKRCQWLQQLVKQFVGPPPWAHSSKIQPSRKEWEEIARELPLSSNSWVHQGSDTNILECGDSVPTKPSVHSEEDNSQEGNLKGEVVDLFESTLWGTDNLVILEGSRIGRIKPETLGRREYWYHYQGGNQDMNDNCRG